MPEQSPSQTVGPFFHDCLIRGNGHILSNKQTKGAHILIEGQVFDGDGEPITDALVEIWQADSNGRFNHPSDPNQADADPHFQGHGRSATVQNGRFAFHTVKPGIAEGEVVPFINVRVFARGMLIHAMTRIYFAEQPDNQNDPVFNSVPQQRQDTLLARLQPEAAPMHVYHFDIYLQGVQETVFFNP